MPTTSESTGRTATAGDTVNGALEGVYDSLRSGEATGEEAIASTVHAFTELVRAAVPVAMSQPARFVDLTFELAQHAINFQRKPRLLRVDVQTPRKGSARTRHSVRFM